MRKKESCSMQVKNYEIMKNTFIILSLIFFSISCQSNYRIEEKKFVNIYADLLILKEMYRNDDSSYFKARDSLYRSYGVDQFKINKTLEYYSSDTQKWTKFYRQVIKRLEQQQTTIKLTN